jgi:hypothetical protein
MSANKELSIRQRVGNFYMKNKQIKKSLIVNHFLFEGIPKSTIYSIIDRVDKGISLDRKPGSGHSVRIDQKFKNKIIEENVNEIGRSYRSIGRKHNIDEKTAKKILNEARVFKKKRKKAPKGSEKQKKRQKKCLEKLRRGLLRPSNDVEVIMDDESYLATSHYANSTQAEYSRLKIKVVPKELNPPNLPQVRPIENFWGILKRRVYLNGWTAESDKDLII